MLTPPRSIDKTGILSGSCPSRMQPGRKRRDVAQDKQCFWGGTGGTLVEFWQKFGISLWSIDMPRRDGISSYKVLASIERIKL